MFAVPRGGFPMVKSLNLEMLMITAENDIPPPRQYQTLIDPMEKW